MSKRNSDYKIFFTILGFILLIGLAGCKVDLNVWVDNTGGGKGNIELTAVPIGEAELRQKLIQKGIEVISVQTKDYVMEANIKWTDFNKAFGTRRVNQDGSIFLDFGNVELGSITAHVDGKIDQSQTNGNFPDSSTVVFTTGRATLVYKPNVTMALLHSPIFLGILGMLAVSGIIIVVYFRNRSSKPVEQPIPQSEKVESQDVISNTTVSGRKFCRDCGSLLEATDIFCTNCGKKRV